MGQKHLQSSLFGQCSNKVRFLFLQPQPGQECLFPGRKLKNVANRSLLHHEGQGMSKPWAGTARSIPAGSCNVPETRFVQGTRGQVGQPRVCLPLRATASLASRSVTVLCNVPCPSALFPTLFLGEELSDFLLQVWCLWVGKGGENTGRSV